MAKVTSKLQITIPKALADKLGIKPGDEVEWLDAGGSLHLIPKHVSFSVLTPEERLQLFREGTERQAKRNAEWTGERYPRDRGWTREELYEDRVRPR